MPVLPKIPKFTRKLYQSSKRRLMKRREFTRRTLCLLILVSLIIAIDYFWARWGELEITPDFRYPDDIPHFAQVVEDFRNKRSTHPPSNLKYSSINFLHSATDNLGPLQLLIIVKSAFSNGLKRDSIRRTWGNVEYLENLQSTFGTPFRTKLVFICGLPGHNLPRNWPNSSVSLLQHYFPKEFLHNDIILADFHDNYGNNTYKSMLALKWAIEEFPSDFKDLLLADDDVYVDLVNLLMYLDTIPLRMYEEQIEFPGQKSPFYRVSSAFNPNKTLVSGKDILLKGLYTGQIYWNGEPLRESRLFRPQKREWGVPVAEYQFNYFPPYAPGAALVLNREAVSKFYYASFFTKHFKIDDVYLGILARKVGIIPITNSHFHSGYPKGELEMALDVLLEAVVIHGLRCPEQMEDLWFNRQPQKLIDCK